MAREVEARLRLSAVDRTAKAFSSVERRIRAVERQTSRVHRVQAAVNRTLAAMPVGAYIGPTAIAYGAGQAYVRFAQLERTLSRTGIKLGATREEMSSLYSDLGKYGDKFAILPSAAVETADAYAEAGASIAEVRSDIGMLLKAQQGMGAEGREVVATWDAARKSFGLMTKDGEAFFDRVAAGGAIGKFEGADLARYLPSLMPIAAGNGFQGLEGTERLVALLETMRDFVGTSEEAATGVQDFLDKINSPTVEKAFKNFNIDLPKALREAKRDGRDILEVMAGLIEKATGGDASQLGKLFGERDSRRVANLLLTQMAALQDRLRRIREESEGMIDDNVNRVLDDAQSKLDRMLGTIERISSKAGNALATVINPSLTDLENTIKTHETLWRAYEEGDVSLLEGLGLGPGVDQKFVDDLAKRQAERDRAKIAHKQYSQSRLEGAESAPGNPSKQTLPDTMNAPGGRPTLSAQEEFEAAYRRQNIEILAAEQARRDHAARVGPHQAYRDRMQERPIQATGDPSYDAFMAAARTPQVRPEGVPQWKRFLLGEAADPDFDAKEHFRIGAPKGSNEEAPDTDALREAHESGLEAGSQSIRDAAYEGNKAGGEVIVNMLAGMGAIIGRDMAATFNANVRIPLPNGASTIGRPSNLPAANVNPGVSMPTVGTPGG